MTAVAVTFHGTRLDDSDTNTDWDNYVIGGGAPASEFPLAYQVTSGTTSGAVNKKINSSTARQGVERYNATGHDMTAAGERLWFCKVYVSDSFDLNATWGVEVNMGSADNSNKHIYNIAGSGANLSAYNIYPAQGGYLITSIDPNIDTWAETADSGGAFDQTAVRFFAVGAQFINGTAKTENVAMDAIDVGKGLTLVSGTGMDPAGTYPDFVATDQDTKANRWGVVTGSGDIVRVHGILQIGANNSDTAVETVFTDSTSIVLYPDGYHSRGLVGVEVDLGAMNTAVTDGCLHIGEGSRNGADANDTRPDYTVSGTTGTFDFTGQMRNFRDVTLTSVCDVDGADIECHLLTQASANIFGGTIIRTNALSAAACLQDPTFGSTTDLRDTSFVQVGAGHAIEIDSAGTYDFNDLFFSGYGADASNSAAVYISINAAVTINVNGGDTPTVRHSGTAPTINNSVTVRLEGYSEGTPVKVIANETVGSVTDGDVLATGFADSNGVFQFSQNYEGAFDPSGLNVEIRGRNNGVASACIADDGGVQTDETENGSDLNTNSMTLLPATPAANDQYFFGHQEQFTRLKLNISTALAGSGNTITWQYWNGSTWSALSGVVDGTNGFTTSGENIVSWTLPGDWATRTENTQGPYFYVRARLTTLGTITTAPVGRKVVLDVTRYFPYFRERTITSSGLTDVANWVIDTIGQFNPT